MYCLGVNEVTFTGRALPARKVSFPHVKTSGCQVKLRVNLLKMFGTSRTRVVLIVKQCKTRKKSHCNFGSPLIRVGYGIFQRDHQMKWCKKKAFTSLKLHQQPGVAMEIHVHPDFSIRVNLPKKLLSDMVMLGVA